jgi:hypothetical protein
MVEGNYWVFSRRERVTGGQKRENRKHNGLKIALVFLMRTKYILLLQSIYYFLTGLWPLVDITSFMKVTGPKTDIWLVKMVGLLTIAISIALFNSYRTHNHTSTVLAVCSASAYLVIDVYYYYNGQISFVYLIDAFIEAMIIIFILLNTGINSTKST